MRYVIINTLDKTLIRLSPLVSVEPPVEVSIEWTSEQYGEANDWSSK